MAASNTFARTNPGSAVSIRENLLDGFYMVAPEDTPFTAALPKKPLNNTNVQWTVDDYGAIQNTPLAEGQDVTDFKNQAENRARVTNYQTIRGETAKVTDVMERADNAPTPNEKAFSLARSILLLNLQIETAATSEDAAVNSTTPQASGIPEMLKGDSVVFASVPQYQTPAAQRPTNTNPNEASVDAVLRSMHNNGASTGNITVFADSAWMQKFTDDTIRLDGEETMLRANMSASDTTVNKKVTVYRGPFGRVTFVDTNPRVAAAHSATLDRAIFLDLSKCALFENKPLKKEPDDAGGGWRCVLKRYVTFMVGNPKTGGYWKGLA